MVFRNLTFGQKLFLILIGMSSGAVLLACFAVYALFIGHYRESYRQDLASLAEVVAHNCQAAVAFGIPEDATTVLASLKARPSVTKATVQDAAGNLLAVYAPGAPAAAHAAPADTAPPDASLLREERQIMLDGVPIGKVVLYDNMRHYTQAQRLALLGLGLVNLIALALAVPLARFLQRLITRPITDLAAVAKELSVKRDYSLRAPKRGDDEVGDLVDAFNEMMSQIAAGDAELRASENRFRTLVAQAVDGFFLIDREGAFLDVNQQTCESLGYSREELTAMSISQVETRVAATREQPAAWTDLVANRPVTYETLLRRKDGTTFPAEVRVGLIELGGQALIMGLARDLSERRRAEEEHKRLEEMLRQAQKMESIGTLAGGIAHDFNNILTVIYGYAELALIKMKAESPAAKDIEQVVRASSRAKELVSQILTFSRQNVEEMVPIDIQSPIKEALRLLRSTIPTSIEIRRQISPHCGTVLANPTQIHQVLMNLCTNAYHAMRDTGGILGVTLDTVEIGSEDGLKLVNLKPGSYVRLSVSDTGHGMDQQTMARIFEPYFTTKPKGEGTGMGLAMVHGIARGWGGHVTVYSEPGKGSTFHVFIPRVPAGAATTLEQAQEPLRGGAERLLVVDDEAAITAMVQEVLTALGYKVTGFTGALEALAAFRQAPDRFDCIITDMTMPRLTGLQLAQEAMRIRPGIPVILCTGFNETINEDKVLGLGIAAFLMKPIVMSEFTKAIRDTLDRAGGAPATSKGEATR